MISDQNRRQKSRDVSSRYLSPPPLASPSSNRQNQNPNPSSSTKHKHKHTAFIRGLWPSSTTPASKSHDGNPPTNAINATLPTTLADHLGTARRKDAYGVKRSIYPSFLSKQKSCSEFGRFESSSNTKSRSSISSSSSSSSASKSSDLFDSNQVILPGRLSVDENALRRRSSVSQTRSDSLSDYSESSDLGSPFTNSKTYLASYMAPTLSSKKSGIEVQSKFMNPSIPMQTSPNKSTHKIIMKRANSVSSPLEFDQSSPSRLRSPSYSSSKPPSSPRGRKNLLHMGLDLIKGKKGGSKLHSSSGSDTMENVHQLRLLQNSWMQWRHANARAEVVHANIGALCENDLLSAKESMAKVRHSVLQKRLQLQKEKRDMKLNMILHSQIKMLEAWGDIERRHVVDVSTMRDYLHAVVCMIPLIEGAKVDLESTSMAFQHTSDLVSRIRSNLSSFSPMDGETMVGLSEMAEVVTQEKSLLEECIEHLRETSMLEIQERNLRCNIIAMDSLN